MKAMSVLAYAVCAAEDEFRTGLPFACDGVERDAIPPVLRRRSSQAMRLAFSAAAKACANALRQPADLPAVFASVAGEIQTTDRLLSELTKADGLVSPSDFHNSVQNSVAGYWSIAHGNRRPTTAIAGGHHTLAMAVLEAWAQLACHGGELLLVYYDEHWPAYLFPHHGSGPLATALILAAEQQDSAIALLGPPHRGQAPVPPAEYGPNPKSPLLACSPLLNVLAHSPVVGTTIRLSTVAPYWQTKVVF